MSTQPNNKPLRFGVSLSTRACAQFDLDILEVMDYAINELGFRRFRLMSYWDETELEPGVYDFSSLEAQLQKAEANNCEVSLCLGIRQPRWPECHVPEWAKMLISEERNSAILNHISYIINKFGNRPSITSYQLENEALNHGIGTCVDFDRKRLRAEHRHVKALAPDVPIVMTTSNSWGIPLRRPVPDVVGFSYYLYQWTEGGLSERFTPVLLHKLRRIGVKILGRKSFCHELQAEPWADRGTEQLTLDQQLALMDASRLNRHINYAIATGVDVIDLWGVEWWYSLPLTERTQFNEVIRSFTELNQ